MRRFAAALTCLLFAIAGRADTGSANSPDGEHRADVTTRGGAQALEIRNTHTGAVRATLRLGGRNSHPVFSPDGHFVAFFVQFAEGFVLTVSDLSGHSWPVARTASADAAPAWSADATHLQFQDLSATGERDTFRVTAGGTRLEHLESE